MARKKQVVDFQMTADKTEASKAVSEISKELEGVQKKANIEIKSGIRNKEVRKNEKKALENQKEQNIEKKRAVEITRELNKLMIKAGGSDEKKALQLKAWRREVASLEAEYAKLSESGADTKKVSRELSKAYKGLNSSLKDSKITGFQKLLNTFKRVGFYRLARRLFQIVEQGLSQGLEKLIAFDNQTNKTASSIMSSFDKINASIALIVSPLLDVIEPVLSLISDSMADIANSIGKASAKMKGLSTYTKVNADYMKDFSQETQSSLLSFDKFETLSNSEDGVFEQASVDDKTMSGAEKFGSVFSETLNIVTQIVAKILELIGPLMGVILPVVTSILKVLNPVLDVLSVIIDAVVNILKPIIDSIADALNAVIVILKGDMKGALNYLGSMFKNTFKAVGNVFVGIINLILKSITDTINGIIDALNFILAPVKWGLKLIGVEWNGIGHLMAPKIDYFANGGLVKGGSLFVAGEHGNAEVVSQFSSGQTGVTNIAQFKQAMLEALFEWSSNQYGEDSSIAIYLDGAEIARSKRFKAELNRTNMELNLR